MLYLSNSLPRFLCRPISCRDGMYVQLIRHVAKACVMFGGFAAVRKHMYAGTYSIGRVIIMYLKCYSDLIDHVRFPQNRKTVTTPPTAIGIKVLRLTISLVALFAAGHNCQETRHNFSLIRHFSDVSVSNYFQLNQLRNCQAARPLILKIVKKSSYSTQGYRCILPTSFRFM